MKKNIFSLLAGILFAIGLGVSQMTDPTKVIGFLRITDNWDPSLAFVMGGAMGVYLLGYKFILPSRSKPIFAEQFSISNIQNIDKPLIIGSGIFGVGWGLSGFCPGPGIASIVTGYSESFVFVGSIIIGVVVYHLLFKPQVSNSDG
ncbi:DUF6691 family protein [Leptospira sp. GIMC2001]|uniref:DUF6691 family protein n=1 Tax=Leptospira sp. GIMC2001 TaxID=1513297 RepID=UPI002349A9B6|nr:DUF6691 family protein [Leptospira sp. GIMC2001]WCL50083.1 YeeE/YedE family protein [Leptospira sp. GIMC2001]